MNIKLPEAIIEKYKIELFILFGSYAENSSEEGSDLDLAYKSSNILEEKEELELLNELSQFYRRGDIDLVNLNKAEPVLKVEIAKKGNLLYGKKEKFEEFAIYAAAIYADTKFLREDRRRILEQRLEARH